MDDSDLDLEIESKLAEHLQCRICDRLGFLPVEAETRMHKICSLIYSIFIDDYRYLDFGCGYHLDVNLGFPQELKHFGGDTGMGTHTDPDHAEFGNSALSTKPFGADFRHDRAKMFLDFRQFIRGRRKGNIGRTRGRNILHDHVDIDIDCCDLAENS